MNCVNHPEAAAMAYCRACGKPLCALCQVAAYGTVFCADHATPLPGTAEPAASSPYANPYYPAAAPSGPSPGVAFLLGFILPGVGAIYNGQYAKGLIHAILMGVLLSVWSSDAPRDMEPLFAVITMLFVFYMAFEAYHTAAKRQRGELVDEFSGLFPGLALPGGRNFPFGPVLLIVTGLVFLLNTMEWIRLSQLIRFWPVLLIALGVYLLWARSVSPGREEVGREQ